jgi:hypothetical protein
VAWPRCANYLLFRGDYLSARGLGGCGPGSRSSSAGAVPAALIDELAHVRLRETGPGHVRIDHDPSRHDDRVIALGLAAHSPLARQTSRGKLWCR